MNLSQATALARSESWSDRAAAARVLAADGNDVSLGHLAQLLRDDDLAVVVAAADGLLARRDVLGVELFADAYERADDQVGDTLNDVLRSNIGEFPEIRNVLTVVVESGNAGARMARDWLGGAGGD